MGKAAKKATKQARRHLAMYRMAFGMPQPYSIILHGSFIHHCLERKVFFKDMLIEMHDASVKLMVTLTTRAELRALGDSHSAAAVVAKRFETLKYEAPPNSASSDVSDAAAGTEETADEHTKEDGEEADDEGGEESAPSSEDRATTTAVPVSSAVLRQRRRRKARRIAMRSAKSIQTIRNQIEKANEQLERERSLDYRETDRTLLHIAKQQPGRYILAVQDRFLRCQLRQLPGVPVIYAHNGLLHYEAPSRASLEHAAKVEEAKALPSAREQHLYKGKLKDVLAVKSKIRKRKKKGVNPLAVKKQKARLLVTVAVTDTETTPAVSLRRQRQRLRQQRRTRTRVRHRLPTTGDNDTNDTDVERVQTDGDPDVVGGGEQPSANGDGTTLEMQPDSRQDAPQNQQALSAENQGRNLRKKLAAIAMLEKNLAEGAELKPSQLEKIKRKAELEHQLIALPPAARAEKPSKSRRLADAQTSNAYQSFDGDGENATSEHVYSHANAASASPGASPAFESTSLSDNAGTGKLSMVQWYDRVAAMVSERKGLKLHEVGEIMPEPPVKMKLKKLLLKDSRFRLTPSLEVELI